MNSSSYNILKDQYKFKEYFLHHMSRLHFQIFSKDQIFGLVDSSLLILENYILKAPLCFLNPSIHKDLTTYIHKLLQVQIDHLYEKDTLMTQVNMSNNLQNQKLDTDLTNIVTLVFALFYKYIIPKRSYTTSFLRKPPNIPLIRAKITYLQNLEQSEQRTPEWYVFRHNTLTASNIWKTFMSEATRNQLIFEKCEPINPDKFRHISINSPMHWGQKYEPLSVMYYEMLQNTKIGDFGCIQHKDFPFIAASPDGINICESSPIYGRMLEIKNIVNRVIDGNPKLEYWIQMQIQMETCDLNECDFLETKFTEYESEEAFEEDGSFNLTSDAQMKGIILQFMKNNIPYYEYAPLNQSRQEFQAWEINTMEKNTSLTWIKNLYWKLEKVSCVLVLRNKSWFNAAMPYIRAIWETIKIEREGDYQHRAPRKKQKKQDKPVIKVIKSTIDMSHIS